MNGRETGGVGSTGLVVIIGAVLLLLIIVVAVAQSGSGGSSPASASTVVAAFSGGSSGMDTGTTGPFTVSGGKQTVTVRMPQEGDSSSLGVYVSDAGGFSKAELYFVFGTKTATMDLPAGTYTAAWESGECTWEMTITE